MLRTGCLLAPQRDFVVTLRQSGLPYRRPPATALLGHYAGQTLTGKFITAGPHYGAFYPSALSTALSRW